MIKSRILTGILAGFISFSMLCTSAFAAAPSTTTSTIDTGKTASLTIVKIKENNGKVKEGNGLPQSDAGMVGMKGIEFDAVRIADLVTASDKNGTATYFSNADAGFLALAAENNITIATRTVGGKTVYTTKGMLDAVAAINALTGAKPGEVKLREFAASHAKRVEFAATDADGKTVKTSMAQGLYLVAETDYSGYEAQPGKDPDVHTNTSSKEVVYTPSIPFLVSLPMTNQTKIGNQDAQTVWQYDVTVYPKNQTAAIPKYIVNEDDGDTLQLSEDFAVGETVTQVITPSAPVVIDQHVYEKYVISDTMDKGLAFSKVVDVRLGNKVVDPESMSQFDSFTVLKSGTDYTVNATADKQSFEVAFLASGLAKLNARKTNSQVVVTFESILTKDAKDGDAEPNRNKPSLTWKNRNTEEAVIEGNRPEVYTYRIELKKLGLTDASKASFTVSDTKGAVSFVEESAGVYHLFDHVRDASASAVTTVRPAKNGTLSLRGVDADTYTFTERSTEAGKELMKSSFSIRLASNDPVDGKLKEAVVTIDGKSNQLTVKNGTCGISVENFPKITLRTGGEGTGMLYGTAALCLLGAVFMAAAGRKKRKA